MATTSHTFFFNRSNLQSTFLLRCCFSVISKSKASVVNSIQTSTSSYNVTYGSSHQKRAKRASQTLPLQVLYDPFLKIKSPKNVSKQSIISPWHRQISGIFLQVPHTAVERQNTRNKVPDPKRRVLHLQTRGFLQFCIVLQNHVCSRQRTTIPCQPHTVHF